jgi:predicted Zn-dependent peptidase
LGTAASVAALTPAALAAHFPETHAAGALTVVVVGDVDSRALAAVERTFGALPRGRAGSPSEAVPGTPRRVTVTGGGGPAEILVGFRTKDLPVKRAAALDLLAAVLAAARARACSARSCAIAGSPTACARSAFDRATRAWWRSR